MRSSTAQKTCDELASIMHLTSRLGGKTCYDLAARFTNGGWLLLYYICVARWDLSWNWPIVITDRAMGG